MQTAKGQAVNSLLGPMLHIERSTNAELAEVILCVQMVLLVDSLRHTGCGDAFAQLKVNN